MRSNPAVVAGLGVVVLWASAFPAIRVAAPELGVAGLSLVRIAVGAIVLLAVAPLVHVRFPQRRDLPLIIGGGLVGMTAYQVLLNWGELHVAAGPASIVVASAPMVSAGVAAIALGEKLSPTKVVGSIIAVSGVVVVALSHGGMSVSSAVWIVVAAAVVQGIYHPMIKPLLARYTGMEVATYGMVAGTIPLLPVLPWVWPTLADASAAGWWSAVFLGVLPSAAGFVLWGYAVARLPMALATSFLYLVPAVAVAIAFVWLDEIPLALQLIGGAVVLVGVMAIGLGDTLVRRVAKAAGPAAVSRPTAPDTADNPR